MSSPKIGGALEKPMTTKNILIDWNSESHLEIISYVSKWLELLDTTSFNGVVIVNLMGQDKFQVFKEI